jgi:integrase
LGEKTSEERRQAMSRGDGRVFLRGTTYWCAYNLRGVEHRESTGTSDEKQAGKFLKARLREVGADLLGARTFVTPRASRLTVAQLCEALKADFELRGKLSPQSASHLRRVSADFGECRAVELSAERIDKYVEQRLADGDRPATVNRATQMLGQCFALAIRRGHLSRAPYVRHLSEAGNARQGFFSERELAAVISHLPEDLQDFARFAACTGMRKGEIASLTWNDIEGDVLTLRGENSKNGESRSIPLVGQLAEIAKRRQSTRRVEVNGTTQLCNFIFHRKGLPVAEFRKSWQSACIAAGVGAMVCSTCRNSGPEKRCPTCKSAREYSGKIFHDLRRQACRSMVQAGVPQATAQRISGHKSSSMFQRYAIICTDDLRTALEKTEAYRETAAKQKVVAIGRG